MSVRRAYEVQRRTVSFFSLHGCRKPRSLVCLEATFTYSQPCSRTIHCRSGRVIGRAASASPNTSSSAGTSADSSHATCRRWTQMESQMRVSAVTNAMRTAECMNRSTFCSVGTRHRNSACMVHSGSRCGGATSAGMLLCFAIASQGESRSRCELQSMAAGRKLTVPPLAPAQQCLGKPNELTSELHHDRRAWLGENWRRLVRRRDDFDCSHLFPPAAVSGSKQPKKSRSRVRADWGRLTTAAWRFGPSGSAKSKT